jgi:hypothetical protein
VPEAHATDVSDAQDPENSWMRVLAGADDSVIVVFVPYASKLYHTSFLLATPQPIEAMVEGVAPTKVPDVFEQDELDVKLIAPAHSSFVGGVCVTQILKLATPPMPEGLLFIFATRT